VGTCEHDWKEVSAHDEEFETLFVSPIERPPFRRVIGWSYCRKCRRPAVEMMTVDGRAVRGVYASRFHAATGAGPMEWLPLAS
jgi:hypothetical protein